jgi:ATP-dependent DNA helicase RecG
VPDFRVANILRDQAILHEARDAAVALLERDPELAAPESKALREALTMRWAGRLGLARVG